MSDIDGTGRFDPIDEIPESSKTLLVVTVLEDLSDSQLVLSIDERGVEPRHYLALIAILTSMTSMLAGRYASEGLTAQRGLLDRDLSKTLDELTKFLDEDQEGQGN